ncbi:MAG TPA: hypothetical protein VLI39_16065 [Sedimentisphaerales bacterium]|nr:hypothetical protein [Sedimentisphaerales bacterium]
MAARIPIRWLVVLLTLAVFGGIASAAATNWQSAGMGDWFLGTNWDGGIPTGGITAAVNNGGAAQAGAGSAHALALEIGAAMENTSSGTVTAAGGSLTAPSLYIGTATATGSNTASGTGLLQMSDTDFSASALLQIGVTSATDSGSAAVSTGQATLAGGTGAVGGLQVGVAVGRGQQAADGILRFEDVAFTGTGSWTIGNAVRTDGGGGTVAVNRAEVVIDGDDASTANLTSLSVGSAAANRGAASANASFSFTGQSVTTGSLSVGTVSAGSEGGSAQVHEASAAFDADLIVTGNASVGTGYSENSAGVENAVLTIAPGRRLEVAGALAVGSGSVGGRTGTLSIMNPAVTLGDGADLSVGGLLTIGQVHGGSYRSVSVEDAHLTQEGGSAALNGGLVVGRATISNGADASASGRLSLDGTTVTAHGAWTIGEASVPSYSGPTATVTSKGEVTITGDASSVVGLTSLVVGNARSDDYRGTVSVTADLALSGGTASVGGLQVGAAAAGSRAVATADAIARFADMTFAGTGEWAIGRATKGGSDGPVGAATVSQAVLNIEGDNASTANLSGLSLGTANAGYGTAQIGDTQFSFAGQSVTTTALSLGTAASGEHGNAYVNGASAVFDADVTVTGNASIGIGSTGGETGSVTIQNVGLTVDAGHAFNVGGTLTVGSGAGSRRVNITGPAVTLGEGVDFGVGGLLTIGQTSGGQTSSSSVNGAHLTLEGGSTSLRGGLAVGLATGSSYVGDGRTTSPRFWLDETSFLALGAWTIGKALTPKGSHSDAVVDNAEVRILGDASSSADLTSVVVGQAHSQGTGSAQATASLTYRGGSFRSSGAMVVGSAQAEDATEPAQATGSATFLNTNASVRSLQVGRYTGVGEQNPSSFAHGSLTLADTIMTVDEDAEFARLTGGVGSATSELSLTRSLLDIEGTLLLGAGSEILFHIDGYGAFGRIEAGAASLDGGLAVAFEFGPHKPAYWDLITLEAGSSFLGDFDSTDVQGLSAWADWSLGFATNDLGRAVYRLAITGVPPAPVGIPAPGAVGLLSVGLGMLLRRRR